MKDVWVPLLVILGCIAMLFDGLLFPGLIKSLVDAVLILRLH